MGRSVQKRANPWVDRVRQAGKLAKLGYQGYQLYQKYAPKRRTEKQVTNQYDLSTVYRRRRMPRRKRRRWVRTVRRHARLNDLSLGTRNLVFNYDGAVTATASNQSHTTFCLYGFHGTSNVRGLNDLARIVGTEGTADDQGITAGSKDKKIHFKSACLDATFVNQADTAVELDMYYFYCKRDTVSSPSYSDLLADYIGQASLINSTGTAFTMAKLGVTPFDIGNASKFIKVYKVKKVILGVGQMTSFMIRSPQDKYLNSATVDLESDCFGKKGWTQGVFVIGKGAPAATTGTSTDINYSYHMQTKYHYTIDTKSGMAQQYIP